MTADWIGWLASAILIATLIRQIVKQGDASEHGGISKWLFAGQCAASVGFVVYSILVDNWVFIVTNSCVLLTAVVGQIRMVASNRSRR